jgi:hypothetical protein
MGYYSDNSGSFGSLKKGFLEECRRCSVKLKSKRMKLQLVLLGAVVFLAACSSPKYVYHFDHYNYSSGKKTATKETVQPSPLKIADETMVASKDNSVIYEQKATKVEQKDVDAFVARYRAMSKSEQKEFKKELKKEIKAVVKKEKADKKKADSIKEAKAMEPELALAAIFGGAGIVFIFLAGISNIFWVLGAVAIVVGAFFFIRWVANGNG